MRTISQKQLTALLFQLVGEAKIFLVTSTDPEMKKTGNPYVGRASKRSELECTIGRKYEQHVNDLRKVENKIADFEAKPRKWGTPVEGTPLVRHDEKLYLSVEVDRQVSTHYLVDGRIVPESFLENWLQKMKVEGARQGLAAPVVRRDFKLESIIEIEINGEHYEVTGKK